ncbi:hypothetical protein QBC38DRAFT_54264 [Podospora fimiseda]|uniref:EthD domain-containing protein n=1 Tax=Podospora fimiseda TaxID=252190 RepID=A0AAN7GS59_9PEZI|nr:hypothetical protein QBC38DRAFT_54264 [Podospora fimiseda]
MSPPRPGIITVKSGISSPDLSSETFRKWYEQIHIPDVLATPKITSALRYRDKSNSSTLPFLAIYNVDDLNWLNQETCEFWKIPLHSDVLPADKQPIFTWAKFETEFYDLVSTTSDGSLAHAWSSLLAVRWERTPSHTDDYANVILKTLRRSLREVGVKDEIELTLFKADQSGICPPAMRKLDSDGGANSPSITKYLCLVCSC